MNLCVYSRHPKRAGSCFKEQVVDSVAGSRQNPQVVFVGVPCETIDVAVSATSEIVLEGEIICEERRTEGPFGEFPGYYQAISKQAIFRLKESLTAVTQSILQY